MSKHRNSKSGGSGGGGGMTKHRKSGVAPKSPKARYAMMLDAKNNERKASPPLPYSDVGSLFGGDKK